MTTRYEKTEWLRMSLRVRAGKSRGGLSDLRERREKQRGGVCWAARYLLLLAGWGDQGCKFTPP